MIIYTHQKSKKRKPNAKQKELAADWQQLVAKHLPKTMLPKPNIQKVFPSAPKPFVRQTDMMAECSGCIIILFENQICDILATK